ncbi:magnesium-protoporphyrin IX monomethyl ester (oxidative) cyclase [Nostoc sp. CCCryo 231-06]|nr:magnesium-protoporphyrin IX monomethyl ester (oxidative) cyclase [Nostoc sp. CCCryo 231-06]
MSNADNTQSNTNVLVKETPISPGFYTTNIKKLANIDYLRFQEDFDTVITDLKNDYNKDKFVRDNSFNQSWDHIQGEARELIIKLLEMYCAAEYSGFILYKELSYQLRKTNSTLSDGFSFMSRDEARHASFLNKALRDFHLTPSLEFLKKEDRKYHFLPFSWFIHSTYLSEKISSCYYINIFDHLKSYPEYSIYPLFGLYKSWSEDENRHGDFVGTIIKSQSYLSNGLKARLVCKFYLVLIFSITYLKYKDNEKLFALIGLDSCEYYINTIKNVNKSVEKHLPVILDIENSQFFKKLDVCILHISENKKISISKHYKLLKFIKKIPHYVALVLILLSLFLVKSIDTRDKRMA